MQDHLEVWRTGTTLRVREQILIFICACVANRQVRIPSPLGVTRWGAVGHPITGPHSGGLHHSWAMALRPQGCEWYLNLSGVLLFLQ